MTAVRQLIALNAELHATRAELADLAVADERERLARELHDLLGRTLSLSKIASPVSRSKPVCTVRVMTSPFFIDSVTRWLKPSMLRTPILLILR